MTEHPAAIAELERKGREADQMATKSPFTRDRQRFRDVAAEYRRRAQALKA